MPIKFFKTRGFSLVEMIFYIAILAFILVIIVSILLSVTRSQRIIKTGRTIQNSSIFFFERLSREIKQSESVDVVNSILNTSPGKLILNSTDQNGTPKTVEFYLASSTVWLKENGVVAGALSLSNARVTNLMFNHLISSNTKAIRTTMTIEAGSSTDYKSTSFYLTTVLRNSL